MSCSVSEITDLMATAACFMIQLWPQYTELGWRSFSQPGQTHLCWMAFLTVFGVASDASADCACSEVSTSTVSATFWTGAGGAFCFSGTEVAACYIKKNTQSNTNFQTDTSLQIRVKEGFYFLDVVKFLVLCL